MATKHIGTVVQILGPVLDIRFEDGQLPELLNAIEVQQGDRTLVCEVAQHVGDNIARCIAMGSTDGLRRGIEALDTGGPITVPVGDACLGRVFNLQMCIRDRVFSLLTMVYVGNACPPPEETRQP